MALRATFRASSLGYPKTPLEIKGKAMLSQPFCSASFRDPMYALFSPSRSFRQSVWLFST